MTIQQLINAITIEKYGSMNTAAKKLYISQPTLSASIKLLESELGYKVFNRKANGVSVTQRGIEFLHYAKNVIVEYEKLNKFCFTNIKDIKLKLNISSQHYAFITQAIIKTLNSYSSFNFDITINETNSLDAIEDVCQKRSQIAVIVINKNNNKILHEIIKRKHLEYISLTHFNTYVFLRANHPLAKFDIIEYQSLEEYPVIAFNQTMNSILSEEFIVEKNVENIINVSDRATLTEIIINTNAYNIGTGYMSKTMKDSGIISIPLNITNDYNEIVVIKKQNTTLSPFILEFIEILKSILSKNL